jgi:uncharacterized protein YbjT (DUF2867 family)
MPALTDSNGGATLTTGEVSQIVQCSDIAGVSVTIIGDISTGVLTMQQRMQKGGTWCTYSPGGVDQTWGTSQTYAGTLAAATDTHNEVYDVGGCELRFSLATAGTLVIHVTGKGVSIMPITYT